MSEMNNWSFGLLLLVMDNSKFSKDLRKFIALFCLLLIGCLSLFDTSSKGI